MRTRYDVRLLSEAEWATCCEEHKLNLLDGTDNDISFRTFQGGFQDREYAAS